MVLFKLQLHEMLSQNITTHSSESHSIREKPVPPPQKPPQLSGEFGPQRKSNAGAGQMGLLITCPGLSK